MTAVHIADRKVWVGDQAIPLLSGEVHYWRLDPHNWRPALKRVREMDIHIVATYACWDFHEISPGTFDFRGETDPRRNLTGFLELLAEEGFWIIFRPGPYIYSEWTNGGVPNHAAQYHRLDPEFLKLAEPYMAAVTEAALPYLATRGGKMMMWQADNEIDPWPHLYSEELGLGRKVGPFQEFLRDKYEAVSALNQAWRTQYTTFENARAVSELFTDDPVLMSRYNDFRSFLHDYVNKVAAWATNMYRSLGVDVPIMLNAYSGVGTQRWADMEKIADVVGPDIYPSREFLNRGGTKEHRHVLEAVRYTRTYSRLPYIPEYEAGIWHDWLEDVGTLPPNHYRLICLSALQAGVAGWNWYMLVNRDNWYQSPINEWGRIRPGLFDVFKQITALYHEVDPTTLNRLTNTAVTFDPLQRSTERPGQDLLQSLYDADIDYEFYDLDGGTTDKNLLFYAGGTWLSEAGQRRLVEYVENGGHLVCIGAYPHLDEHLHEVNLLDIPAPDGILSASPKFHLSLFNQQTGETPWIYNYDRVPGEPIRVTRLTMKNHPSEELALQFDLQTGAEYTVGYSIGRGQGRLTIIGMQPTPGLLLALHEQFNVPLPCRAYTSAITTALFSRDGGFYLFASNAGNEDKSTEVVFAPNLFSPGKWSVQDLVSGHMIDMDGASDARINVTLPRKDATIFHLFPK
jgi:hypothetical protein